MLIDIFLFASYETTRIWGFIILIVIGAIAMLFPPIRQFLMSFLKKDNQDKK
jgi:F0F1-type ATP synthase assembly protein I